MAARKARQAAPLRNISARSAPRSGELGVLPVDELPQQGDPVPLRLAVRCPSCDNYGVISGTGTEFGNVTKLLQPVYLCGQCSWRPTGERDTPERWKLFYRGRWSGTLVWAANEEHLDVLIRFLEEQPKRRELIEYPHEFDRLVKRLPNEVLSGRARHDVVSMLKKLRKTRPRHIPEL